MALRKLRALWMRLRGQAAAQDVSEFDEELAAHVALHTEDGIRAGLSEEEARRQALVRLGGVEQTRQAWRERRGLPWLESVLQDIRYGWRTLRRTPGFTLTAVLTLALGIGACTAIFSLVNAVLIRSLPYGDPERLVYLFAPNPHLKLPPEIICPSYGDFYDIKRENKSFADLTAYEQATFNLATQGAVQRVGAARVDENFFSTLQSAPELGRALGIDDNEPGHDKVAVISHSLWLAMFAGSADALGQTVQLNGVSYRIVGVMPPDFGYPFSSDLPYGNPHIKATNIWLPLVLTPQQKQDREPGGDVTVARLRPGVSIKQAQAEMSSIMARLDRLHGGVWRDFGALVESFTGISLGPVWPLMRLLLGAVLIVLLIACGNAANLLLARASGRMRELGVRAALGAGRGRMMRQLLTESLMIGLAGGAAGVVLAYLFLRVLPYLDPGNIPRLNEASLDTRVLLFTVLVSLLTSVLAGILPALSVARLDLTDFMKTNGARGLAGGHSRVQSILIVAQAAMVVVLLAGAGLFIRSYINVESIDTGFSQSTVTMNIALDNRYGGGQQRREFFTNLIARLSALPGVRAVGAVNSLPLSNSESVGFFTVSGYANQKDQMAQIREATPSYFSAMNIPLTAGRLFTDAEDSDSSVVAVINQSFAKQYFAGRDPIGGKISQGDQDAHWNTVVGVVADVRHTSLEEPVAPQIYYPFGHADWGSNAIAVSRYIAVRSALPAAVVTAEVRAGLKSIDPNLAVTDIHTMGDLVSQASARRRFQTSMLTAFAFIALALALVGLYGLMAYSVSRRTQELGIRMALGAQRIDVMLLVIRKAAWLLGFGLAAGLGCAWAATRVLKSFLFGVGEHDPLTLLTVCGVLAACGLMAAFLPARRAASIDPMQALRTE